MFMPGFLVRRKLEKNIAWIQAMDHSIMKEGISTLEHLDLEKVRFLYIPNSFKFPFISINDRVTHCWMTHFWMTLYWMTIIILIWQKLASVAAPSSNCNGDAFMESPPSPFLFQSPLFSALAQFNHSTLAHCLSLC